MSKSKNVETDGRVFRTSPSDVWAAERRRGFPVVWSLLTALLSLAASPLCGRSLWIDELMRFLVQKNYTVGQLLACKHLSDFDSQSPIGFILWRPVQSLLGIELGGFLLSALSAAVIAYVALSVVRRWKGAPASPLVAAVIAINPMLVYYGGELWFYGPWAAAFAVAFLAALEERPVRLAVAGLFFVAFHFAGLFVWFFFAAVCCCVVWKRDGFVRSVRASVVFALPALFCLPLYLRAQFAAAHLDSQGVQFARLASLPAFLWDYFVRVFPSLTGGWWFGVALMAAGAVFLFRSRRRAEAVAALAAAFGWIVYTSYTFLRGYSLVAGRFWLFALAGALPLAAYGCERLGQRVRGGFLFAVLLLVADLVGTAAVVQQDGRSMPYRRFAEEIAARADSVVFPNHYEARPFRYSYPIPNGAAILVPSYWEQGEAVRERGLRAIRALSPLTPAFVGGNGTVELAEKCGWTSTNRVTEVRTPIQRLSLLAHVFPEPNYLTLDSEYAIVFPLESELTAESEASGRPVFLPGDGWRVAMLSSGDRNRPLVPALCLSPGKRAALRVYVPRSFSGGEITLNGFLGRGRSAPTRYGVRLDASRKGDFVSTTLHGGRDGCYFLDPAVK